MDQFGQWAQSPPLPLPEPSATQNRRSFFLRELASRAKSLAEAIDASEKASERRRDLDPGASRAALTTANAKWARAAEDRDRKERNFDLILAKIIE